MVSRSLLPLVLLPALAILGSCQATEAPQAELKASPPRPARETADPPEKDWLGLKSTWAPEESALGGEPGFGEYPEHAAPSLVTQGEAPAKDYVGWTLRAWFGTVGRYVADDNVTFMDPTFGTVELAWDDPSFGFGIDVERRFSKLLGLDLALGYTEMDIDFNHTVGAGVQTDTLGVIPIWLALNFHVLDSEKFDLYLGPQIAYFIYLDDLSYVVPGVGTFDFNTDNEFPSLGFLLGADYWFSEKWGVNLAFRYQDADADSDHNLPLDPAFVTIGVSRRLL